MISGAYISVQDSLNHAAKRICELLEFPEDFAETYSDLELLCKWGCDGSSGGNEYMQHFKKGNGETSPVSEESTPGREISEEWMFLFGMVPLRLIGKKTSDSGRDEKFIFWQNPTPSSTRYCRPLRFYYIKESAENTKEKVDAIEEEIAILKPFDVEINGKFK